MPAMTPIPAATRFRRRIRQLHRWLGLLIAAQVVCWIAGGLIMSALQLDAVRGEHVRAPAPPVALDPQAAHVPLADVLREPRFAGATAATLASWQGRLVYRLELADGPRLVDAVSGGQLSPIDEAAARAVATADYAGPGAIVAVEWVDTTGLEYRGRELPLWRVRFDDPRDTTLYVSPATGTVVARRNDLWRVFDFVWMLHIMDYEEREDFNHPLLVATAATALLFTLTGLVMLVFSFRRRET
jgi:hypothetical protein